MDKEYALGKDGLPLSRYCIFIKISEENKNQVENILKEKEIAFKTESEPINILTNETYQEYLIELLNMYKSADYNMSKKLQQDALNIIDSEAMKDNESLNEILNNSYDYYEDPLHDIENDIFSDVIVEEYDNPVFDKLKESNYDIQNYIDHCAKLEKEELIWTKNML